MEKVFLNGQFVDRSRASVDIEDRGNVFGDGIYEVIRVYNGQLFTVEEHLQRLMESAKKIRLSIPYGVDQIRSVLKRLIEENNLQLGIVYLQVSRGASARQHLFPENDIPVTFFAYAKTLKRPHEMLRDGVRAKLEDDIRWLKCDIKSLNLLGNILAKQSAADDGCFEAIFSRDDVVTEGSSSNILIVKNGTLQTHPANNLILNGITRKVVLQKCKEINVPVEELTYTVSELLAADEVLMTSTTAEIMPIVEVNGKMIGHGKPGPITIELQRLFEEEIEVQCPKV